MLIGSDEDAHLLPALADQGHCRFRRDVWVQIEHETAAHNRVEPLDAITMYGVMGMRPWVARAERLLKDMERTP